MQNYIKLTNRSLFHFHYAFFDVSEYFADQIFIEKQIKVKFGRELKHPDEPYTIIFCKIKKKDEKAFLEAMEELERKMFLLGHTDYSDFCSTMSKLFE